MVDTVISAHPVVIFSLASDTGPDGVDTSLRETFWPLTRLTVTPDTAAIGTTRHPPARNGLMLAVHAIRGTAWPLPG